MGRATWSSVSTRSKSQYILRLISHIMVGYTKVLPRYTKSWSDIPKLYANIFSKLWPDSVKLCPDIVTTPTTKYHNVNTAVIGLDMKIAVPTTPPNTETQL